MGFKSHLLDQLYILQLIVVNGVIIFPTIVKFPVYHIRKGASVKVVKYLYIIRDLDDLNQSNDRPSRAPSICNFGR